MPLYLSLLRTALTTEVAAVLPIIMLLLAIGITTATFQAAFQLEDTALNLVPKTIAMIVIAIFGGFGAVDLLRTFAMGWISHATLLVHQPWS